MGYNKVILEGNLVRDVEIRYSQGGSAISNTSIAVNRKWKSQTGEAKEEVMFVDLTFFGRTAEIANQYLRKGSRVLIDGRLKLEQWTAQDNTKRSKHMVVVENLQMIGSRDDTQRSDSSYGQSNGSNYGDQNQQYGGGQTSSQTNQGYSGGQPRQERLPEIDVDEGEIPF